jgi:hypothetical protein
VVKFNQVFKANEHSREHSAEKSIKTVKSKKPVRSNVVQRQEEDLLMRNLRQSFF